MHSWTQNSSTSTSCQLLELLVKSFHTLLKSHTSILRYSCTILYKCLTIGNSCGLSLINILSGYHIRLNVSDSCCFIGGPDTDPHSDQQPASDMPYSMQRSTYRSSVLNSETSSSDIHKAVESRPKPKFIDSDRDYLSESHPPPPPPSPVSWRRDHKDRK